MWNFGTSLYDQADGMVWGMVETGVACHEIAVRARARLTEEHQEILRTCLDAFGRHLDAVTQSGSSWERLLRKAAILTDTTRHLGRSAREIRDIEREATAELGLCLEDGWRAVTHRQSKAVLASVVR